MKNLVIAPHGDDEVLGIGGYLLSRIQQNDDFKIVFVAVGNDIEKTSTRYSEIIDAMLYADVKDYEILFDSYDGTLEFIPTKDIVREFERLIDSYKPDRLFLPYKSTHQDHKIVYDASMAALRLRNNGYLVPFVALYEYPFVTQHFNEIEGGKMYFDITDFIDDKISMFYQYKSQIKESPSPLNDEGIRSLARIRGLEVGLKYAERFYIQKMVV
jgi:LmbE family N-acetylglucosaminyl deacetylase